MLGLLYILLSFTLGWAICSYAFPGLAKLTETDLSMRKLSLSPYLVLLPAWYVVGTLGLTWPVYLLGYLFKNQEEPLLYANLIAIPFAIILTILAIYIKILKEKDRPKLLCGDQGVIRKELFLVILITLLAAVLMWRTFFAEGDRLYIGVSVFSDFSPHIGMIRSFSYGNNFPTTYPHYAGEDIKYHFMFQFLVGNLEYLGLRIDYAFNLPSILSFVSAFMLLYVIAVKITGRFLAGALACLFFAFRSAKTLFTYLAQLPEGTGIIEALRNNYEFISDTPNENWGLWNLNVYCNQRHLAFGLTVFFLVVLLFLPHLYQMFEDLKDMKFSWAKKTNDQTKIQTMSQEIIQTKIQTMSQAIIQTKGQTNSQIEGQAKSIFTHFGDVLRLLFFRKQVWIWVDLRRAIAAGILLGSLSFFHGAAVIGCLCVLFVMAILSRNRLEYLIAAVITVFLSFLQTGFFINGSAVSTELLFGFIAENKTLFGVASYLERLLGVLPIVILVALCLEKGAGRYLILAFSAPLIFAFTVSLTVDVTVNHKYIMMSCILLGVFAASLITRLFERREVMLSLVGGLLIILLTATGIYDFTTVLKKNTRETAIVLDSEDPLTTWVRDNSNSQDLFLTDRYAINQLVFGGAMLFEGWPYFPWSAGYDTDYRTEQVKLMYSADTPEELDRLIKLHKIRYIVVDQDIRRNEEISLKESNIIKSYERVYSEGEGDGQLSIYDTTKPLK